MGNTNEKVQHSSQPNVLQIPNIHPSKKTNGVKNLVSCVWHSSAQKSKASSKISSPPGAVVGNQPNSENLSMTPEYPSLEETNSTRSDVQLSSLDNNHQLPYAFEGQRSEMIPVQGDIEPSSSSSHAPSSNYSSQNDPSLQLSSHNLPMTSPDHRDQSMDMDRFSFQTASLPYDENDSDREFSDKDLLISENDLPSNFSSKVADKNISSLDSLKKTDDSDDDMSFPTASPSFNNHFNFDSLPKNEMGQTTNEVANKTTKQVESIPQPTHRVEVFITYAHECGVPDHMKTIASIALYLVRLQCDYSGPNGKSSFRFNVISDQFERKATAKSMSLWLESNIKKAHYVLVCVSPGYSKLVEEKEVKGDDDNFEKSVHAQYIYRRIHSEYINNGSKNYRFIPILVSQASLEDVPNWLRDTIVYRWDKDIQALIFRLIDREEHLKPSPGPPPKLKVSERFPNEASNRQGSQKREC